MAKNPKTWTVTVEPITGQFAGLVGYGGYLESPGHENHKRAKTNIVKLFQKADYDNFAAETWKSAREVDKNNTKGGPKMATYAMSYCFSLPPAFKPTKEQWKSIATDIIQAVCTHLDLDANKWMDFMYCNLHDQKNPHLNLVIAKTVGGKILEKVDQRSTIKRSKEAFTEAVATHCKISTKDYVIEREVPKTRSGRTPKWEHMLQLAQEAAAKNEEILKEAKLQKEQVDLAKKELANLLYAAEQWVKAVGRKTVKEEEYEQEIIKSYEILSNMNVEAITNRIQKIREVAEATANKKIKIGTKKPA